MSRLIEPLSCRAVSQPLPHSCVCRSGSSLVVYSIDPLTGDSSMVEVSGCEVGYPVGMAWDPALDALIVGTQTASTALFCAIVPSSGEGKPMGRLARGGSEATSDTFFAAYLSASKNGVALRVGHRQVSCRAHPRSRWRNQRRHLQVRCLCSPRYQLASSQAKD